MSTTTARSRVEGVRVEQVTRTGNRENYLDRNSQLPSP
jgi:hypothetical protein